MTIIYEMFKSVKQESGCDRKRLREIEKNRKMKVLGVIEKCKEGDYGY